MRKIKQFSREYRRRALDVADTYLGTIIVVCPKCGSPNIEHLVCPFCGHAEGYDKRFEPMSLAETLAERP